MSNEIIRQLTKGDLGHLLLLGQRLWVKPQPLQLNAEQALLGRHKLKYLFGVPLRFEGQVLGAIVVGSRTAGHELLGQEQQQQLTRLAQLVALFLDNVRLRTSQQRRTQAETSAKSDPWPGANSMPADEFEHLLAAVMSAEEEVAGQNTDLGLLNVLASEVGETLQLKAVLDAALKRTQSALGAEASWCYLFEGKTLTLRGHQGLSDQYVVGMRDLKPGNGVEGMAFSRNEPVLRDGLLFHSGRARTLVKEEGLRTVAAVPLRAGDKTFGVLAVAHRDNREWSLRDERMLISISRQVAQAVVNSQTFSEVKEKAQTWEANYNALQQTNLQLAQRTEVLEQQVQKLHHAEQQMWTVLAASQQARHGSPSKASDPYTDEQLVTVLRKVLSTMGENTDQPSSPSVQRQRVSPAV
jgi:GAF domain-containing protein